MKVKAKAILKDDLWHEVVYHDDMFTVVADNSETRGMPNTDYDVYINSTGERIGCTNAHCWEPQCRAIMNDYRRNHQLDVLREIKKKHPDTLVLFREPPCYRALLEDADTVHSVVETPIFVSHNGRRSTMFDIKALDTILPKLVARGIRIAIEE